MNAILDCHEVRRLIRHIILVSIVACLLAGTIAAAIADEGPALLVRDVREINAALARMSCEKNEKRPECVMPPGVKIELSWKIVQNRRKALAVSQDFEARINQYLADLPKESLAADGKDLTVQGNAAFQLKQIELLKLTAFLPGESGLAHFKKSELDPLALPPEILTGIISIVDFDK